MGSISWWTFSYELWKFWSHQSQERRIKMTVLRGGLTFWLRAVSGPPLAHHFLFRNQPVTSLWLRPSFITDSEKLVLFVATCEDCTYKTSILHGEVRAGPFVRNKTTSAVFFAHIFPSGSMNERLVSLLYILLQFWGRAEGSCESPLMLTLLTICPCAATPAPAPPCRVWVRLTWAVLKEVILPLPAICRLTVVA